MQWQHWRLIITSFLPGIWLLFALSFGKADPQPLASKWKWTVPAIITLLLIFAGVFQKNFFQSDSLYQPNGWAFLLGWSGYGFYICFMLSLVLVVTILERTLRASRGRKRWQVKFLVLGIGGYFAFRIYTSSHALIFHTLNLESSVINAAVLLAANVLMSISIIRAGVLKLDIYPSHKALYNTFTVMVVGVYFLALGLSAKISSRFLPYSAVSLMVFLGLLGLLLILLSDRLRVKMKLFVSRHFKRPQYDYRKVWTDFTERTAARVEEKSFCEAIVKMISEMFEILSVSIWLNDENQKGFQCVGSTALSDAGVCNFSLMPDGSSDLMQRLHGQTTLIDLETPEDASFLGLKTSHEDIFQSARIRYLVPLKSGREVQGFISLADRVRGRIFSVEETDILKTICRPGGGQSFESQTFRAPAPGKGNGSVSNHLCIFCP